jgi:hypothetical protein
VDRAAMSELAMSTSTDLSRALKRLWSVLRAALKSLLVFLEALKSALRRLQSVLMREAGGIHWHVLS